jgi:tetratricopeptide (TPR) repeat protein
LTQCPECSASIVITDENCPSCNFPVAKLRGLCAATLTQDTEMVAALIQLGADVNSVDQNGRTPLMIASFIGDVDIVEMLLAAGANPEFTNDAGENALTLAQTKDVERLLRRAIVVHKFSAARKKETEDVIPTEQIRTEEVAVEEVPADIEEALKHLEPAVQPPQINFDSTQPIPDLSEEIPQYESKPAVLNFDATQQIAHSLDSTQPLPIVFKELEIETEQEEESFTELEADLEADPLAADIDRFIQTELQDVQPAIKVDRSNRYDSPTLDPIEESLTENPDEQRASEEIDEFIQTELQDVQPPAYFEADRNSPSLTLDPMEFLMEPPMATNEPNEDEFLQEDLFDVQPSIRFESRQEHPSLTLDPMEELMMRPAVVEELKHDEYLESELQSMENVQHSAQSDLLLESLDPTEQLLEESQHREVEIQQEPEHSEPVIEEPAVVVNEPVPQMPRELQRWDDWKQIEQAVAFAPWKIESDPVDYEPIEEIELAQPIDELIPPPPPSAKSPEVPPEIFMNSTRTRNIAIGVGVAIFFVQILLFMNWPLNSRKTVPPAKVVETPTKRIKPSALVPKPAPAKPAPAKPKPTVVIQKLIAKPLPEKPKPKIIAATREVPPAPTKKQEMIKYESKKSEPPPETLKASVKSAPVSSEKLAKARELNNQGSDLLRAGKVSEGISLLEQAVHTFPKNTNDVNYASALLNLGRAWRMAGRPDISIRLLEKRMKINIERDEVARELMAAKRQAVESGMGIKND